MRKDILSNITLGYYTPFVTGATDATLTKTANTLGINLANSNTFTGQQIFNTTAPQIGTLTASKFVLSDASKNLVSGTAALQVAAGIPTIVASTFEKAETGTDANVLTYTAGAADEFLNVMVASDVSAITGTSIVVTITWKDSNNATATSTLTLTAVGDGTINLPINVHTATNVVVSTVFVGVSTNYVISSIITRYK